jgi:hypothetical protein
MNHPSARALRRTFLAAAVSCGLLAAFGQALAQAT